LRNRWDIIKFLLDVLIIGYHCNFTMILNSINRAIACTIMISIDYIFYGKLVIAPYNFLQFNFLMDAGDAFNVGMKMNNIT
jgi:hypothetical protein